MSVIPWIVFLVLVFALLALDLGVLNRKVHEIHTGEALKWTGFWIGLAMLFGGVIYLGYENHLFGLGLHEGATEGGKDAILLYYTGYFIEKALSLDNIAVMAMIFASFRVPLKFQHRVLFWGILGALIFRGIMIGLGAAIVSTFHSVLYFFGALLVVVAIKSTFGEEKEEDPKEKWISKFMMKHFRYTPEINGMHFFQKIDGKEFITPLLVCLVVIEVSDVIFAVDSIPAIFGITTDPFIVFTSNIFAILGLRSLYFVLASIIERFKLIKYAIFVILMFVAVKLLLPLGVDGVNFAFGTNYTHEAVELPIWSSLAVVLVSITFGIVGSIIYDKKHPEMEEQAAKEREEKAELEAAVEQNENQTGASKADDNKSEEHTDDVKTEAEKTEDKSEESKKSDEKTAE